MTAVEKSPGTNHPGRPAEEVLAWSRDAVTPVLRSAVAGLDAPVRHVAGYHFGWWDERGTPAGDTGGKAIRPALVLVSAQAAGGDPSAVLPAAAAVELVHNFSLLHDDVMDGDATRRHRPTAWRTFGVPAAILAGDGLLSLAFELLSRTSRHDCAPARLLSTAVVELVNGQAADLSLDRRAGVSIEECVRIAAAKTGALLECACALGGLLGGGDRHQVEALRAFGRHVGVAFQIADDVLDIWGGQAITGKPAGSDLARRRKTMPVTAALASGAPAARELAALYERDAPCSPDELARAARLVDIAGGRRWALDQLSDRLTKALACLHAANPTPRAAAELAALAELVVDRSRPSACQADDGDR